MQETLFADILLPVPIPGTFTYRVPLMYNTELQIGMRVLVSFGARKVITGVVKNIHQNPPKAYEAKYILEILEQTPSWNTFQFQLLDWISGYYMATVGEVFKIALPTGFKLSSESRIQLNPDVNIESIELSEKEVRIVAELRSRESLTFDEVAQILDQKTVHQWIKKLIDKEVILIFELLKEKYKPKIVKKIKLNNAFISNEALQVLVNSLNAKPLQQDVVMKYLSKVRVHDHENDLGILKSALESISESSLKTLIKNGIFVEFEENENRLKFVNATVSDLPLLSDLQQKAYLDILAGFSSKNQVLLHGVTGSGKTEVYIHLIHQILEQGQQALFLLPEIALTTQIVTRLQKIFGDKLGVYHSKFSDNERVEVWKGILAERYQVVVGVRSSLFLPFNNLGLVIVDEEHESSYKQNDPAPRYHARETAMMLAHFHHAKVLLASATPSIESYYFSQEGKWGFASISQRYGNAKMPVIQTINLTKAKSEKRINGEISYDLITAIKNNKEAGGQSILFQNRRGYSPFIQCDVCTWVPYCPSCSVSLTLHLRTQELKCHYCGYKEKAVSNCKACGSTKLSTKGMGTEKLEDELKLILTDTVIKRMDLDTTRSKFGYQQIIDDFEAKNTDILVGTQMVTKGLDFENVTLVGVFDIDRIIHFPDFRAQERAFQLLSQVSGRAGRKQKEGLVLIQTTIPNHPIIEKVIANDYVGFYQSEIYQRELLAYPPFVRLIKIIIKSQDKENAAKIANVFVQKLTPIFGQNRVLGPHIPTVERINNYYFQVLLLKLERKGIDIEKSKKYLQEIADSIVKVNKKTIIDFDVDPVY